MWLTDTSKSYSFRTEHEARNELLLLQVFSGRFPRNVRFSAVERESRHPVCVFSVLARCEEVGQKQITLSARSGMVDRWAQTKHKLYPWRHSEERVYILDRG